MDLVNTLTDASFRHFDQMTVAEIDPTEGAGQISGGSRRKLPRWGHVQKFFYASDPARNQLISATNQVSEPWLDSTSVS
jgi:hypothetical protein